MKKHNCFHFYFFLLFTLFSQVFIISCNDSKQKNRTVKEEINDKSIHKKPPSSFSDTISIELSTAVFYNPDSLQLEKIKKITDERIFESIVHECFYQMRNARSVIKKFYPGVKILEVKNVRYLLFKKLNGTRQFIDLNSKNDAYGIFLFDGIKDPVQTDMTNIDSELGFYYTK